MLKDYVVFDLETTGLSPEKDTMIEIGALKVIQGKVADRFSEFINPHQKLTEQISELRVSLMKCLQEPEICRRLSVILLISVRIM